MTMTARVIPMRSQPDGEARLFDVVRWAHARGLHLVTNGRDIYVTPIVMPGERLVGICMASTHATARGVAA